jgi:hypothetical protein
MSIPSIYQLSRLFFDDVFCINYLLSFGVFYEYIECESCKELLPLNKNRLSYRCSRRACEKEYSYRKFTIFFGSRLSCSNILYLGYLWLCGTYWSAAHTMTGHSEKTITAYYMHFRNLVINMIDDEDTIVGGEGVEVEIDETKLGKQKYNHGHQVEGVWILAGVERTTERKVFFKHVHNRNWETIREVIQTNVRPGSIILTDMWKGYAPLNAELGYIHKTVNHSEFFKNPIDGTMYKYY